VMRSRLRGYAMVDEHQAAASSSCDPANDFACWAQLEETRRCPLESSGPSGEGAPDHCPVPCLPAVDMNGSIQACASDR
jgi:hypothetical protein